MICLMYLPTHITLQPGDNGDFVAEMQRKLVGQKLLSEGNISGYYDGITTSAVKAFQALNGVEADGIAGPETLRLLAASSGFFSNTEGGEAGAAGSGSDEDKIAENGDRFDDFVVTQQVYAHQEQLDQQANLDYLRQQDYNTINELRAAGTELGQGGRNHQPLWGKENEALAANNLQAIQDNVRTQQVDLANQEKGQQAGGRDQDQLQVTREGAQAKTLGDSLKDDPTRAAEAAKEAQAKDGAQRDGPQRDDLQNRQATGQQPAQQAQLGPDGKPLAGPQQAGNNIQPVQHPAIGLNANQGLSPNALGQQAAATQPGSTLPVEVQRTGRHLDHGSRMDATQTGHHLDDRGVQNLGSVPPQMLGQLNPSSTPNVGIGGPARGV